MEESKKRMFRRACFFLGIVFFLASTVLFYYGINDYIQSAVNGGKPQLLACTIIGIILVTLGVVLLIFAHVHTPKVTISVKSLMNENTTESFTQNIFDNEYKNAKLCQECGTYNDFDSNFCKFCGVKLSK